MRIAAVGECTIDRYLDLGVTRVGGISLNFAVHARHAGAEYVALVSCTGADAAASMVRRALATADVEATWMHQRPGATASQDIQLAAGGERHFPPGGYAPGVLADFRLGEREWALLRDVDVIAIPVFRQLMPLVEPIIVARDLSAMRVADLLDGADLGDALQGLDALLDTFELLFISGDEAMVERLLPRSRGTRSVIVVTHGGAGSSALVKGARHVAPAELVPPDECVDSTGCGDAYQAAFTVAYARDRDVPAAMRAGAKRAARVIRHLGAVADAR